MTIEKTPSSDFDTKCPLPGEYIEICIAPDDKSQYDEEVHYVNRANLFIGHWQKLVQKLDGISDRIFILEESFLGQRLHIHGICMIKNIHAFLLSYRKLSRSKRNANFALYKIKDSNHFQARLNYITQDLQTWIDVEPIIHKKGKWKLN